MTKPDGPMWKITVLTDNMSVAHALVEKAMACGDTIDAHAEKIFPPAVPSGPTPR